MKTPAVFLRQRLHFFFPSFFHSLILSFLHSFIFSFFHSFIPEPGVFARAKTERALLNSERELAHEMNSTVLFRTFVTLSGSQKPRRRKDFCGTNTNKVLIDLFQKVAGSRGGAPEKRGRGAEPAELAELSKLLTFPSNASPCGEASFFTLTNSAQRQPQ